jgi:hypothetical protein
MLMYLNPDLVSLCNVRSVPDAMVVRGSWGSNLPAAVPQPPQDFSADGYLIMNRGRMDVAGINRAVRNALDADGFLGQRSSSKFLPTIVQTVQAISSNAFRFRNSNIIASDLLSAGDRVKIVASNSLRAPQILLSQVAGVGGALGAGSFTITTCSNSGSSADPILDLNLVYTLVGPEIADSRRVALIDAARQFAQGTSCNELYPPPVNGRKFNSFLYRILYPDAQGMTAEEAYLDYVDHLASSNMRIRTGDDIVAAYVPNSEIAVKDKLTLFEDTARLVWGMQTARRMSAVAGQRPTAANETAQAETIFLERGVKLYIEDYLHSPETSIFVGSVATASNVNVGGRLEVSGEGAIASGVLKLGPAAVLSSSSSAAMSISGIDSLNIGCAVTGKNFKSLSDKRLKTGIRVDQRRQQQQDLLGILRIPVVRFCFRDEVSADSARRKLRLRKGVLAQEIKRLFPDAVGETLQPIRARGQILDARRVLLCDQDIDLDSVAATDIVSCRILGADYRVHSLIRSGRSSSSWILGLAGDLTGNPDSTDDSDCIELELLARVHTVDHEYLLMALLNAVKCLSRSLRTMKVRSSQNPKNPKSMSLPA